MVCVQCGTEDFTVLLNTDSALVPYNVPLHTPATYTRVKRFRKYLNRAAMRQSANTVPSATWEYLLPAAPYTSPCAIVRRLKAGTGIGKKCYDSLPFLVQHMCPHLSVPHLPLHDQEQAMRVFTVLDSAYEKGEPFVSYLFVLEYILEKIGRADMIPFIHKIRCRRRRAAYRVRLDRVFSSSRCKFA